MFQVVAGAFLHIIIFLNCLLSQGGIILLHCSQKLQLFFKIGLNWSYKSQNIAKLDVF